MLVATISSQTLALQDALDSGSSRAISAAISTIARSRGIAAIAAEAGVSPTALHAALADAEQPGGEVLSEVARRLVAAGRPDAADTELGHGGAA